MADGAPDRPPGESPPPNPWVALAREWGDRAQGLGVRALAGALEHLLRQQPWARERLRAHAGGVVRLAIQGQPGARSPAPVVMLRITPEGLFEPAKDTDTPRASLWLTPSADAVSALIDDGPDGLSRHLRVEGDVMLAAALGELARQLRWDAEEDLSKVVGDVAAHRLMGWARAGLAQLKRAGAQPFQALSARAARGEGPAVSRARLGELDTRLRGLDDDLARLEARAARLG